MTVSPAGIFAIDKRLTLVADIDRSLPVKGYLAKGMYDHVPAFALERIPVRRRIGIEKRVITIFPNKVPATTEAICREFYALAHRAADSHEILAIGADEPDIQRKGHLIALEAIWNNCACEGPLALALTARNGLRRVEFLWPSRRSNYEWSPGHLFVGVSLGQWPR